MQCQIKTSNYNCLRALVFVFCFFVACVCFLVIWFGTSSAKTVREHDQWGQTQETTPTQETQRKTENQKPRKAAKRNQLALTSEFTQAENSRTYINVKVFENLLYRYVHMFIFKITNFGHTLLLLL